MTEWINPKLTSIIKNLLFGATISTFPTNRSVQAHEDKEELSYLCHMTENSPKYSHDGGPAAQCDLQHNVTSFYGDTLLRIQTEKQAQMQSVIKVVFVQLVAMLQMHESEVFHKRM